MKDNYLVARLRGVWGGPLPLDPPTVTHADQVPARITVSGLNSTHYGCYVPTRRPGSEPAVVRPSVWGTYFGCVRARTQSSAASPSRRRGSGLSRRPVPSNASSSLNVSSSRAAAREVKGVCVFMRHTVRPQPVAARRYDGVDHARSRAPAGTPAAGARRAMQQGQGQPQGRQVRLAPARPEVPPDEFSGLLQTSLVRPTRTRTRPRSTSARPGRRSGPGSCAFGLQVPSHAPAAAGALCCPALAARHTFLAAQSG